MKFLISLAQVDSVLGDVKKNIKHHLKFIDKAIEGGADLVVFPELSLTGYSVKDINWDTAINPEKSDLLKDLKAKSRSIAILIGGIEESPEFEIFNSAFFLDKGEVQFVHRKVYPPAYGMFEEMRYFSQGKFVRTFHSRLGKLGILICEDLWHLSLPYILAQDGAQAIITISASPTQMAGESKELTNAKINTEHHIAYARLLSSYIVFCNRVGYEDGVNFWGGSEVVSPMGDVIVSAKLFDEDLIFAEIDENEVRRARRFSRHFIDENPQLVLRELLRIVRTKS